MTQRNFVNELGSTITINVDTAKTHARTNPVGAVQVQIVGPYSVMDNMLTPKETMMLALALDAFLAGDDSAKFIGEPNVG